MMKDKIKFFRLREKCDFALLLIFLSLNLFGQKGKYNKVIKENTVTAYKDFLVNNPQSEYAEDVNKRLIVLEYASVNDWKNLTVPKDPQTQLRMFQNAVSGYTKFVKSYPNTEYEEIITTTIQELDGKIHALKKEEETRKQEAIKKEELRKQKEMEYLSILEEKVKSSSGDKEIIPLDISEFPFKLFALEDLAASWWGIRDYKKSATMTAKSTLVGMGIMNVSRNVLNINGQITDHAWYYFESTTPLPLTTIAHSTLSSNVHAVFYSDPIKKLTFTIKLTNGELDKIDLVGSGRILLDQNGVISIYKTK